MRIFHLILLLIISFTTSISANENKKIIETLKKGGYLVFIRHAYAPGGGDPANFLDVGGNVQEGKKIKKKKGYFELT